MQYKTTTYDKKQMLYGIPTD